MTKKQALARCILWGVILVGTLLLGAYIFSTGSGKPAGPGGPHGNHGPAASAVIQVFAPAPHHE